MARPETLKPAVQPSPLQSLIMDGTLSDSTSHLPSLHSLAIQIKHNLQHQHFWTDLAIHTHSPLTNHLLPRPLLSGLPPQRLYIHPDEQMELLRAAGRQRKANGGGDGGILDVEAAPEREWVLPTRLTEKWTLRRMADVFDALAMTPPTPDSGEDDRPANPWRAVKRALLATADTDSTVVYYIIQDGVVKPRQN